MKSLLLLASLMSMAPTAAFAHHHHQVVRETCTVYRRTETYNPGHYDQQGNWVGGGVVQDGWCAPRDPHLVVWFGFRLAWCWLKDY